MLSLNSGGSLSCSPPLLLLSPPPSLCVCCCLSPERFESSALWPPCWAERGRQTHRTLSRCRGDSHLCTHRDKEEELPSLWVPELFIVLFCSIDKFNSPQFWRLKPGLGYFLLTFFLLPAVLARAVSGLQAQLHLLLRSSKARWAWTFFLSISLTLFFVILTTHKSP